MTTEVAPANGPELGAIEATTGVYVNSSAVSVVEGTPPAMTVTSTSPVVVPAGLTAVQVVAVALVSVVLATVPKSTVSVVANPVPVIVTVVPPARGPEAGEIEVTAWAGAAEARLGSVARSAPAKRATPPTTCVARKMALNWPVCAGLFFK
jgi:hypothetical protein